ncbi:MAG TPA: 50S ribosomal protein L4 [Longimicrobiales bacterium]
MFKARVFSAEGKQTGERDLPETLFDGTVHEAAMYQAVKAYLSNQRQGTAATKTRAYVSGGNKKPWRQKGTGRARQGSTRSPQWRGGGNVFGPRAERNFHEDLPKQVKRLARRSAYNVRAQDGSVLLVDAITIDEPKTKQIVSLLETTGAEGNVLLLTDGTKQNVWMSARNLEGVQVRPFGEESTYDVLWADTVIIEAPALEKVKEAADA